MKTVMLQIPDETADAIRAWRKSCHKDPINGCLNCPNYILCQRLNVPIDQLPASWKLDIIPEPKVPNTDDEGKYICARCRKHFVLDWKPAMPQGVKVRRESGYCERWKNLCPDCYERLKSFLGGRVLGRGKLQDIK